MIKHELSDDETKTFKTKWRKDLNQTWLTAKLDEMLVGDSFVFDGNRVDVQLMRVNVSAWGRRHKRKFSITKHGTKHIVIRVSRPKEEAVWD